MTYKNYVVVLSIALAAIIGIAFSFDATAQSAPIQPPHEAISSTVALPSVLIGSNEVLPLLDTRSSGDMESLSVTATLPCDSSNNPEVDIIAGEIGDTVNVISGSADYTQLDGPNLTCLFEGKIDQDGNQPNLNRVFLTNTGISDILLPLGTMITMTGIIPENATQSSGNGGNNGTGSFWINDDFSSDAGWVPTGSKVQFDDVNGIIDAIGVQRGTNEFLTLDLSSNPIDPSQDFIAEMDWKVVNDGAGGNGYAFCISEIGNDRLSHNAVGEDNICISISGGGSQGFFRVTYNENGNFDSDAEEIAGISGTTYYPRLEWNPDGGDVTLSIFTDPLRTTHLTNSPHTISITSGDPDSMADLGFAYFGSFTDSGPSAQSSHEHDNLKVCVTETTGSISDCQ